MRGRLLLLLLAASATLVGCAARARIPPDSPLPMTPAWRVALSEPGQAAEGQVVTGLLATDGQAVFLATETGVIRALDPATGKSRWERPLARGVLSYSSYSGGMLLLRPDEGGLDAVDPKTGSDLWRSRGGSAGDSPAVEFGGRIAVVGHGATLIDARSGEKLWTTRGLGTFSTTPLLIAERLVAGTREGALHCLDLAAGKLLWTYRTRAPLTAAPIADDKGRVFIGTGDGRLLALSLRSGKRLWEWRTGVETAFSGVCYKDTVCFASHNATMLALKRANGHLVWRAILPSRPLAPPVVRGDVLLGFCYGPRENRTTVIALDVSTGRRLGMADAMGEAKTAPLVLGSRLVFSYRDRSVAALALSEAGAAEPKGLTRRRRLRDLGAEATPTPTPGRYRR